MNRVTIRLKTSDRARGKFEKSIKQISLCIDAQASWMRAMRGCQNEKTTTGASYTKNVAQRSTRVNAMATNADGQPTPTQAGVEALTQNLEMHRKGNLEKVKPEECQ